MTDRFENSTCGNGMPGAGDGATGGSFAAMRTFTSAVRASGSPSRTVTNHSRSPVSLSRFCGSAALARTRSKSLSGFDDAEVRPMREDVLHGDLEPRSQSDTHSDVPSVWLPAAPCAAWKE